MFKKSKRHCFGVLSPKRRRFGARVVTNAVNHAVTVALLFIFVLFILDKILISGFMLSSLFSNYTSFFIKVYLLKYSLLLKNFE